MSTITTNHRAGCQRPGWTIEPARSLAGIVIARCNGCGAVELRTADALLDGGDARRPRNGHFSPRGSEGARS